MALMSAWAYADTENFYFEDFTGDYYLSRDDNGISHLKVVESLTTIFPDYRQNKGICRMIPFTNQDGANITLPDLNSTNIKITRNGLKEPIYSIKKINDSYEVCTGDENYVLGKQVYMFEYNFEKVITDFNTFQEIYWDTNGNGWMQKFENVTARVHFAPDVAEKYTGNSWCYVGKYGEKGSERCVISEIDDGLQFTAQDLRRNENLTFNIEMGSGSFIVPEPEKNYVLVYIMLGFFVLCILCLIRPFRKFLHTREKARYYKSLFIRPEYAPNPEYGVAEMAENYIGRKKDAKVAVLLDMVVKHQINLVQKGKTILGQKRWAIQILNSSEISPEGVYLVRILSGGAIVNDGDEIEIKTRTANSTLVWLKNTYEHVIEDNLMKHELVEKNYKDRNTSIAGWILLIMFIITPSILFDLVDDAEVIISFMVGNIVGAKIFVPVMIGILVTSIAINIVLKNNTTKFLYHTNKGLEVSRYMDGLKLYIKMAEKDRLAFLQSATGAEISKDGIVKIYEKLLPYAAVLGLEESWMRELGKYYELEEVQTPDWYVYDMTNFAVLNAVNAAVNVANYSTTYSSSGGSSSSSSSGGGGGGFSGGGGGGGGGHGR